MTSPKSPQHTNLQGMGAHPSALRQKIAEQMSIVNKTRYELRRVNDLLRKARNEEKKCKAHLETTLRMRARQQHRLTQQLHRKLAVQIQANASLRNSEAQFRALVESSADHIFMLDEKGTFLFSNDQVNQFGLQHGYELIGRRLQEVYPHEVCSVYREKLKTVFRDSQVVTFTHEKETPKGDEFHQDTLYPIYREKAIWAVGGICRNISEQKRIEKHLVQAQKLDACGTLVTGVAHEINNPVNLLLFNLPLLENMWKDLLPVLDDLPDSVKKEKIGGLSYKFIREHLPRLVSDMQMASERVARIATGLKEFSRKSNPAEKSAVEVNSAVRNAVRLAGSTLSETKTQLHLDLGADLPLMKANLQNLEQIVLNLLINAHQSIEHDHGDVRIATAFRENHQTITISVQDNGRGIDPFVAEKIFDPFVTDRQANGGTGLGLSVTFNIVKAHNGEISFESKPGEGTIFTVELPVVDRRKLNKIMVVDDDRGFRTVLIHFLSKKTGSVVEGYANGAEALIRLGSHPPDLLVLDMFMPEIDGLGVCKAIKNEFGLETTKVIIVTGYPDHPSLDEAAHMGFTQIFTKPLDMDQFLVAVKEGLDGESVRQIAHSNR